MGRGFNPYVPDRSSRRDSFGGFCSGATRKEAGRDRMERTRRMRCPHWWREEHLPHDQDCPQADPCTCDNEVCESCCWECKEDVA